MKNKIRIASGQGFWSGLQAAPMDQVTKGQIDYIMMDFLAEVTMSIKQKQKKRNPELGYAKDLVNFIEQILPTCIEKNIKNITNCDGVNPSACTFNANRTSRRYRFCRRQTKTKWGISVLAPHWSLRLI